MKVNIFMECYGIKKNIIEKNNIINELKEGKGFIKEYENRKLLDECEYLNVKRNGKGKEYMKTVD